MTYAQKRLTVLSAEMKAETTLGTENAPAAATDAFYLQPDSDTQARLVEEEFEYDGDLGPNAVGHGPNRMVAPSGRMAKLVLPCYFRGPGIAFSASVYGLNRWHLAMQSAGFAATGSFTGGSEKWTYEQEGPEVTPTSVTIYAWAKQLLGASQMERVKLLAGLANLRVEGNGKAPPKFIFEYAGIYDSIADAAFTAPTLAPEPLPALMTASTFAYGAFSTAEVYGLSYNLNRDLSTQRIPQTGGGASLGVVAGGYRPEVTVTIAQEKFATWNPYSIRDAAGTAALAWACGGTQYNRVKLNGGQAQLREVKENNRGKLPLWDLVFLLTPSDPANTDSHNWVTD